MGRTETAEIVSVSCFCFFFYFSIASVTPHLHSPLSSFVLSSEFQARGGTKEYELISYENGINDFKTRYSAHSEGKVRGKLAFQLLY